MKAKGEKVKHGGNFMLNWDGKIWQQWCSLLQRETPSVTGSVDKGTSQRWHAWSDAGQSALERFCHRDRLHCSARCCFPEHQDLSEGHADQKTADTPNGFSVCPAEPGRGVWIPPALQEEEQAPYKVDRELGAGLESSQAFAPRKLKVPFSFLLLQRLQWSLAMCISHYILILVCSS